MNTFNAPTTQINTVDKMTTVKCKTVDLQGYVIIVVQTKDNKVKLYGSPAVGRDNLEVADEIMDVNETRLEDMTRTEVIGHIHECIQSCLIKLRVRRRGDTKLLSDIGHNIVQDAFLIAVEEQARQRLQRLSALKRITPVDMSQLSVELNRRKLAQTTPENRTDLNGYISSSTVYVTSITEDGAIETKPIISSPKPTIKSLQAKPTPVIANGISIDNKKDTDAPEPEKHEKDTSEKVKSEVISESDAYSAVREQLSNGRSEKLIGEQPENRIRATAVIENNKLGPGEKGPRRRSGSSIVVLDADEDKRPPDDDQNMIAMLSVSADTGPHREMAVDVPDSFIARNKTPPRYPPPRPPQVPAPPDSDSSGSLKNHTLETTSGPSSGLSFGSKKSKASTETTKCGDLFRMDTPSDHKVQLLISNGDDSLLDVRGVSYSARTDSVLIREAMYASYQLPPGFDTTPVLLGREVAVDVPDSFVQIVKTTPKYPSTDRKIEAFHKVMGIGHAAACCDGQWSNFWLLHEGVILARDSLLLGIPNELSGLLIHET